MVTKNIHLSSHRRLLKVKQSFKPSFIVDKTNPYEVKIRLCKCGHAVSSHSDRDDKCYECKCDMCQEKKEMTSEKRKAWKKRFMQNLYMNTAEQYADLSTCERKHVGAVLVKRGRIISTGFNGSVEGADHCTDVGCLLDDFGHCRRTVHAEQALLMFCAKEKISTDDCTMFCVYMPCSTCLKLIQSSGIKHVVWRENYEDSASVAIIHDVEKTVLLEQYFVKK